MRIVGADQVQTQTLLLYCSEVCCFSCFRVSSIGISNNGVVLPSKESGLASLRMKDFENQPVRA